MSRLLWKLYLLWHGYCPKHGIEKSLAVGYDVMSMNLYCEQCERERQAVVAKRIAKAQTIIAGRQP